MSILDRAELLLQAKNYSGSGDWLDESGNSHDAVPTNSPLFLAYDGVKYCRLPGVTTNYVTVPDASSLDITGDIELVLRLAMDDWTPSSLMLLFAKFQTGGQRSWNIYMNTNGRPTLQWSEDGTALITANSGAATGFTNGSAGWLKVTLDVDGSGGGGGLVKFYTSTTDTNDPDEVSWTQLGGNVTPGGSTPTNIHSGTSQIEIGTYQDGGNFPLQGKVYRALIRDGIDGSEVLDVNFDGDSVVEPFASFTDETGNHTVTVNRGSSGYVSTVVDRDMWVLDGSNDHLKVADNDNLDFGSGVSYTLLVAARGQDVSAATSYLISKNTAGTSYFLYGTTAGLVTLQLNDGGGNKTDNVGTITDRTIFLGAGRYDADADEIEAFVDGVGSGSPTSASMGDLSNASPLFIGAFNTGGYLWGQVHAVALFREALSDAEIGLASSILLNPDAPDPSELHDDGLWWWIQQYEGRISGNDTELVGELNVLNGTSDKEYAEARGTYLGVDPAG